MIESESVAAQAELLENVIATAQRLIKAEKDKSKITPTFIAEKVNRAADIFATDSPLPIDQQQAVAHIFSSDFPRVGYPVGIRRNVLRSRRGDDQNNDLRPCFLLESRQTRFQCCGLGRRQGACLVDHPGCECRNALKSLREDRNWLKCYK